MTVICWDGKTLACDKQSTSNGRRGTVTKGRRTMAGDILAWTGDSATGQILADWWESGHDVAKWPECQKTDQWSNLIIISGGCAFQYQQHPSPIHIEDDFYAWGAGAEFAIGAMAMGASAEQAVRIASEWEASCGMGVDVFEVAP